MSDHDDDTDAPLALVSFDIPGMLAKLTGITAWTEFDGPDSGCGLDYWYDGAVTENLDDLDDLDDLDEGEAPRTIPLEAYVNIDQMTLLLSVYPKDSDDETPDGQHQWRIETDLSDPESPYAAFVR